jgi:hypothetical protein
MTHTVSISISPPIIHPHANDMQVWGCCLASACCNCNCKWNAGSRRSVERSSGRDSRSPSSDLGPRRVEPRATRSQSQSQSQPQPQPSCHVRRRDSVLIGDWPGGGDGRLAGRHCGPHGASLFFHSRNVQWALRTLVEALAELDRSQYTFSL